MRRSARNLVRCASVLVVAGACLLVAVGRSRTVLGSEGHQNGDKVPYGWMLAGDKATEYRAGVDSGTVHEGRSSAYLRYAGSELDGFGTLMQTIDAERYAGKRVRLRADVRAQDVAEQAGLWMRVDKGSKIVAFDNMHERPIRGTEGWKTYDVVLDVPSDASDVAFGVLLAGSGEVWLSHVTLEPVGPDVQLTGAPATSGGYKLLKSPVNLDFTN